jgi:hypothetical protein
VTTFYVKIKAGELDGVMNGKEGRLCEDLSRGNDSLVSYC